MDAYELVEVTVSNGRSLSTNRFTGRRLARVVVADDQPGRVTRYVVYATASDRFAVNVRSGPDWSGAAPGNAPNRDDPSSWTGEWYQETSRIDVYPTLAALAAGVPATVFAACLPTLETSDD